MTWTFIQGDTSIDGDFEISVRKLYSGDFADRHADTVVATALHLLHSAATAINGEYSEQVPVTYSDGKRQMVWHSPSITWNYDECGLRRTPEGKWVFVAACSVYQYWKRPGDAPMVEKVVV